MKKSVVTGILVKDDQNRILLVKKPEGVGPYPGTYLTPGGGVKTGEKIEAAALRELYEETSVKIKNLKQAMFLDDVTPNWQGEMTHYIMLLYTADFVSGSLEATEGDDDNLEVIKFFNKDEVKEITLSPPLEKLLKYLGWLN